MSPTGGLIEAVYHHLVLPSRLPGRKDRFGSQTDEEILSLTLSAVKTLESSTVSKGAFLGKTLTTSQTVVVDGQIERKALVEAFENLRETPIFLHIAAQNAGLLIRMENTSSTVIFEAFEASPTAESVLSAINALQCDYPNSAVAVPLSCLDSLQKDLAKFLEQANTEPIQQFAAKSRKAGVSVAEYRDSTDPALITQMLMTLLEAHGSRVPVPILRKRVRDDVCWHNAELPWRRSPFWLVLRVSLQRILCLSLGPAPGRVHYKFLICMVHATLLSKGLKTLSVESCHLLRAKLCRRLAKLESERESVPVEGRHVYDVLFEVYSSHFSSILEEASDQMRLKWSRFKSMTRRNVPPLPSRVDGRDLRLRLPNSRNHLQKLLQLPTKGRHYSIYPRDSLLDPESDPVTKATITPFQNFAGRYHALSEQEFQVPCDISPTMSACSRDHCVLLARKIEKYLDMALSEYEDSLEQKSLMVLNVFELWIAMDNRALELYPLLRRYHPGFQPALLDVLQLLKHRDMSRLQSVQRYLQWRQDACKYKTLTLFSDPSPDSFAVGFFDGLDDPRSPYPSQLVQLRAEIERASERARESKLRELEEMNQRYADLSDRFGRIQCTRKHGQPWTTCEHCRLRNERRGLRMTAHEDYLPSEISTDSSVQQKAILFELAGPPPLLVYRDTTWRIMITFGFPYCTTESRRESPKMLLSAYEKLKPYAKVEPKRFCLASTTKSFLVAHYKVVTPPVRKSEALLPFGLTLSYYDSRAQIWPAELPHRLTFARHFGLDQSVLHLLNVQGASEFEADAEGTSSYRVISGQNEVPPGLTVHEYNAYRSLISEKASRWLSMLRELASSNINFSSEATMHLYNYLALQVGPTVEYHPGALRTIHWVFNDAQFCAQLLKQIKSMMEAISHNWRECYWMNTLISLVIRVSELSASHAAEGVKVLQQARHITWHWVRQLRLEIAQALDSDVAQRVTAYALLASLVCKRTFSILPEAQSKWESDELRCFIEVSIMLQQSLLMDPSMLSSTTRGMLVDDIKMTHSVRHSLRASVNGDLTSLEFAINAAWPEAAGTQRTFRPWQFLEGDNEWWMMSTVEATEFTSPQYVHYHLLDGHLLVDLKPLGKLPPEIRKNPIMHELFGDQHLLSLPSALPGMTYRLTAVKNGHEVHLGLRDGRLVVRARIYGNILELVDRSIFGPGGSPDVPLPLVEDCLPWLNLTTKQLEFRKRPHLWQHNRTGNWMLDVPRSEVRRRNVLLVDPQSELSRTIASIFDGFEAAERLTIFQPLRGYPNQPTKKHQSCLTSGNLSVELKRMDLDFIVTDGGVLHCRQLRAEIDPNQDAGTWYGLRSAIVMRAARNHTRRSVIIPVGGAIDYKLEEPHVAVSMTNVGNYGQFTIDSVLGRIVSPAEPMLIYTKAQLHAFTSFPLPDPLTGRTGTEEALACLTSASSQPWTTLGPGPLQPLLSIARLTPSRHYYPRHRRRQQDVGWDSQLTMTIQHERYRPTVESIMTVVERLSAFATSKTQLPELPASSVHLRQRSYARRRNLERPDAYPGEEIPSGDLQYDGRDRLQKGRRTSNVYEIVRLLHARPSKIHTTSKLVQIMEGEPLISGYTGVFAKPLLSDLLETNVRLEWGRLVNLCRKHRSDPAKLTFDLAMIAFGQNVNMALLRAVVAFCLLEELNSVSFPPYPDYRNFSIDETPTLQSLVQLIRSFCKPYKAWSLSNSAFGASNPTEEDFEKQCELECRDLASRFLQQWPCRQPTFGDFTGTTINLTDRRHELNILWQQLYRNSELCRNLANIQQILNRHCASANFMAPTVSDRIKSSPFVFPVVDRFQIPTLSNHLLPKSGSELTDPCQVLLEEPPFSESNATVRLKEQPARTTNPYEVQEVQELARIVDELAQSSDLIRQQYSQDLRDSVQALQRLPSRNSGLDQVPAFTTLEATINQYCELVDNQYEIICQSLASGDARYKWLRSGQLWPCLTTCTLLEQLRSTQNCHIDEKTKRALIDYGVIITRLQRLLRIDNALKQASMPRLQAECINSGHANWQPKDFPDWLLLEIDSNMLIREEQVNVALATVSPISKSNSVLQMNMGQGKTSVIMPMVACLLADSKRLVRLIVPKALLAQTAQILQSRLGALIGRRICHVPFSRKSSTEPKDIVEYGDLHREILDQSGVILALPEHILSFRLSGTQRLADSKLGEATVMIKMDSWLTRVSRDVLDECDLSLGVKTQLIYPSGLQLNVDGHPYRWKVTQELLSLIEIHSRDLQGALHGSIEIVDRPTGGFPFIYILRPDAEQALRQRLVDDICAGRTGALPAVAEGYRCVIRSFLTESTLCHRFRELVCQTSEEHPKLTNNLFLLRGLLVHGILFLCLKKRWNVQYGLHHGRDPIAVPFHAKGVPSEQAEWGQPDVAILLTCLAFYYNGLTVTQLRQALQQVLQSDDPSSGYEHWVHDAFTLPEALRHWNVINIDDDGQVREIWKHLRFAVVVINHYLNNYVFPIHARQFAQKLQASGWDIPLFSIDQGSQGNTAMTAHTLTTGFSGTNDNRRMLPLMIRQVDLPQLSHTNAEVLTYLLKPQNREYVLAAGSNGKRLSEVEFLHRLHGMKVRLLIDAGAQILELDNRGLAKQWLDIYYEAPAVAYFDRSGRPLVLSRNGKEVPLLASPFAENLNGCLVYLDEAHTRGTDLNFPPDAKAVLTLSLGQTKDHTVQAAMRLRQLGTTQSIVWMAPPEVHQSILDVCGKKDHIDSADVVKWLLEQSCHNIQQLQALYLSQGYDFCRRTQAAFDNTKLLTSPQHREHYLQVVLQPEQQTLEQLYKPKFAYLPRDPPRASILRQFSRDLDEMREVNKSGFLCDGSSMFHEVEQEREVEFQVEEIRETRRPPSYDPLKFPGLHPDLLHFVHTGQPKGFEQVFHALRKTALGRKYDVRGVKESRLYVSMEFTRTIQKEDHTWHDDYLRPVHWLLYSPTREAMIIITPEEAENLIPIIRTMQRPGAHLALYAAAVTKKMAHQGFNELLFYSVPPLQTKIPTTLAIELGLLAGRLYFSYAEYKHIISYLQEPANMSFCDKPLDFLQEWLAAIRQGQEFGQTPMGYICQGRPLQEDHLFFVSIDNNRAGKQRFAEVGTNVDAEEDSDVDSQLDDEIVDEEIDQDHVS